MGGWLAKFKLDEVPQLWHVVQGEMSLVGPRPEDPSFVERHGSAYDHILSVRPGITGLSQLAFAEESRILDDDDPLGHYVDRLLPQKVNLDRLYASQRTLCLDLQILIWTVMAVILRRQVAVHRGTGRMNLRKRYRRGPPITGERALRLAPVSVRPLPSFRCVKSPSRRRQSAGASGGTTFLGANRALRRSAARDSFRASPSANPVGRREEGCACRRGLV